MWFTTESRFFFKYACRHSGECVRCSLHMRLHNAGCHRLLGSDEKLRCFYAIGAYVFFRGDTAPIWDTIKYRCGEERQAVMLSPNRVHPLFYLFRARETLIPGGSPSLL